MTLPFYDGMIAVCLRAIDVIDDFLEATPVPPDQAGRIYRTRSAWETLLAAVGRGVPQEALADDVAALVTATERFGPRPPTRDLLNSLHLLLAASMGAA